MKVLNEMLKPFSSRELSDLNAMKILFPEEVKSGGVPLPQYETVLETSTIFKPS